MGRRFQYKENKCMVEKELEEYELESVESAYEDPGENAKIGFMASGGAFHDVNDYHWADHN